MNEKKNNQLSLKLATPTFENMSIGSKRKACKTELYESTQQQKNVSFQATP